MSKIINKQIDNKQNGVDLWLYWRVQQMLWTLYNLNQPPFWNTLFTTTNAWKFTSGIFPKVRFLYSYVDEYLSTDHQFVSHFNEHQLSLRPSSCHFDFRFRALCTSPLVLIFQLWPFQYQISPFYFHMFVDPLPATSTLGATLLGATLGAGEVATLTGQVQTVTQILAVVQQNPILIIHLVLLDTEENRNLHLIITSLNTVKPWYSKYAYNKFTLAGKSLLFPLLKIWTTRYKLFKYNKLCH